MIAARRGETAIRLSQGKVFKKQKRLTEPLRRSAKQPKRNDNTPIELDPSCTSPTVAVVAAAACTWQEASAVNGRERQRRGRKKEPREDEWIGCPKRKKPYQKSKKILYSMTDSVR